MNNFFLRLGLDNTDNISVKNQLARVRLTLIISFAAAFAGIVGTYILSLVTGTSLSELTRDPSAVTHSSFYVGILSNLGIMLWSAATAICFFGASLLSYSKCCRRSTVFLLLSGTFSLILALDDIFRIHETMLPRYFHVSEVWTILGYFIIGVGYLVYSFRQILMTDYLLLILALIFLGLSVTIDEIFPYSDLETFIEDSFKFVGIVFWLAYFSRTAFRAVYDCFADG